MPLAKASHVTKPTISVVGRESHTTKGVSVESYYKHEELEPGIPFASAAIQKPPKFPKRLSGISNTLWWLNSSVSEAVSHFPISALNPLKEVV